MEFRANRSLESFFHILTRVFRGYFKANSYKSINSTLRKLRFVYETPFELEILTIRKVKTVKQRRERSSLKRLSDGRSNETILQVRDRWTRNCIVRRLTNVSLHKQTRRELSRKVGRFWIFVEVGPMQDRQWKFRARGDWKFALNYYRVVSPTRGRF